MKSCPNKPPVPPIGLRIAVLADSPTTADCEAGHPFSDGYGSCLRNLLASAGIELATCWQGHVIQQPAPKGEIGRLPWTCPLVQEGLAALRPDLASFQPHFVILLGNGALRAATGRKASIDDRRGYLFESCELTGQPVRCLATYPPQRIIKEHGLTGVTRLDLRRALAEARRAAASEPFQLVSSTVEHGLGKQRILDWIAYIRSTRTPISLDIEGGVHLGPSCIGFAANRYQAIVVPFMDVDGCSIWSEPDEIELWEAVAGLLADPLVPKCLQNALYEGFVLGWTLGIVIHNLADDIMLKHFELYCELEKSLEFQASIYTRRPYWKISHKRDTVTGRYVPWIDGRRATSAEWFTYNGLDCCITQEINEVLEGKLAPKQREHYQLNVRLLTPVLYMMLRGLRYDRKRAKEMLAEVQQAIYEKQDEINREASKSPSRPELAAFYAAFERAGLPAVAGAWSTGPSTCLVTALLPLLTAAFCPTNLRERREVEEVSWEPRRWNGKKWVKAGKRLANNELDVYVRNHIQGDIRCDEEEPHTEFRDRTWFKPVRKLVTRSFPVTPATLEDVARFAKDSCRDACERVCKLLNQPNDGRLLSAQRGELAILLGIHVKISATGRGKDEEEDDGTITKGEERDANWYIYEHCKLPPQFQKEGRELTDKLSSDNKSVVIAYLKSGKDEATRDPRALTFLALRHLLTKSKTLAADCDPDGRIRCSYNLVGTETHRLTCYKSMTGSGYNLQTVTKSHRGLFKADDGCWICQRDLSGADGWTVAAYAAMLGDPTMLEDYRAKLKPAQILTLMQDRGAIVNQMSREELRPLCKPITEETDWRYFANKRRQHGRSYKMGKQTTSDQILTDGFKLTGKVIYASPSECEQFFRDCFDVRYPGVVRWHAWTERQIAETGVLVASNGFQRRFHGRKSDQNTIRAALAHLPQVYTTAATTLALLRLWRDPANRRFNGTLRVEPLHTVHDSLLTQWPQPETSWAKLKMAEWFDNPLEIAGLRIVIPASGTYGPNWKDQTEAL